MRSVKKEVGVCLAGLVFLLALSSCESFNPIEAAFKKSYAGGDVPKYIQFQNYRYRTGAACKAQLGAIGTVNRAGPNVFELKYIPDLESIGARKTASFSKTEKGAYKLTADVKLSELGGEISGMVEGEKFETGQYTIYFLTDIAGLVKQLNNDENKEIKNYLKGTKNIRIVTAIIKVKAHRFVKKSELGLEFSVGEKEASKEQDLILKSNNSSDGKVASVKILEAKKGSVPGVSLADGSTYAYEYGRILWSLESKKVVDILIDRPSRWYQWSDAGRHNRQGVTSDPGKL